MLLFNSEKIPHASPEYFNQASKKWQKGRFRNKVYHRGRNSHSPRTSKDKIYDNCNIIQKRIFIAKIVS